MQSTRREFRAADRMEQRARRAARHGHCYNCALHGKPRVKATVGELCSPCFDALKFVRWAG